MFESAMLLWRLSLMLRFYREGGFALLGETPTNLLSATPDTTVGASKTTSTTKIPIKTSDRPKLPREIVPKSANPDPITPMATNTVLVERRLSRYRTKHMGSVR